MGRQKREDGQGVTGTACRRLCTLAGFHHSFRRRRGGRTLRPSSRAVGHLLWILPLGRTALIDRATELAEVPHRAEVVSGDKTVRAGSGLLWRSQKLHAELLPAARERFSGGFTTGQANAASQTEMRLPPLSPGSPCFHPLLARSYVQGPLPSYPV